jgi:hypothetical protein
VSEIFVDHKPMKRFVFILSSDKKKIAYTIPDTHVLEKVSMKATLATTTTWAGLDDNVRACVLLHLEPRDLANVPPLCQKLLSKR